MLKVPYLFYVLSCVKGFKLVNTVPLYHFEAPVAIEPYNFHLIIIQAIRKYDAIAFFEIVTAFTVYFLSWVISTL